MVIYKLVLYPTQTDADANTGAIWTIDNIAVSGDFLSATSVISTGTVIDSSDQFTHIEASGTITVTLPDIDTVGTGFVFSIRNAGAGVVTLDGDGAETVNGAATVALAAGTGGLVISDATQWYVTGSKDAQVDTVNTFTKTQSWTKGADVASAATLILGTDGNYFDVTGTTGISAITVAAGTLFMLQFDDAVLLTHHATNLDLPSEADITTEAGDVLTCYATAANQVQVVSYTRASGGALTVIGDGLIDTQTFTASDTWVKPTGCSSVIVEVVGGGGGGGGWHSSARYSGGAGGTSSFGSHVTSLGGGGGTGAQGTNADGTGGTGGTGGAGGDYYITGDAGSHGTSSDGGDGGNSAFGHGGRGSGGQAQAAGEAGGYGCGGGGGGVIAGTGSGSGGGGGGEYGFAHITAGLGATEVITIGAGGSWHATPASTYRGSVGTAGFIRVRSYS